MINPVSYAKSYFKTTKGLYKNDIKDLKTLKDSFGKSTEQISLADEFVQKNNNPYTLVSQANHFINKAKFFLGISAALLISLLFLDGALKMAAAFYLLICFFYYLKMVFKAFAIYKLKRVTIKEFLKSDEVIFIDQYSITEKQLNNLFKKRGYEEYIHFWK
jgi:hypothetical protein